MHEIKITICFTNKKTRVLTIESDVLFDILKNDFKKDSSDFSLWLFDKLHESIKYNRKIRITNYDGFIFLKEIFNQRLKKKIKENYTFKVIKITNSSVCTIGGDESWT